MKVGDRISVFEIYTNRAFGGINVLRPEVKLKLLDYGDFGADISTFLPYMKEMHYFLKNPIEAKHVCTMVIKSIKNEKH